MRRLAHPVPVRLRALARAVIAVAVVVFGSMTGAQAPRDAGQNGSRVIAEREIAVDQPGPHGGGGLTTAYPFFEDVKDLSFYFRKRVMHPGSSIGSHLQEQDEVYYIVGGVGEYTLDGRRIAVGPGTALLTRKGSTHALKQVGKEDLTLIVSYLRPPS